MTNSSDRIVSIDQNGIIYTYDGLKHVYTGEFYSVTCFGGRTDTARVYDVFFPERYIGEEKIEEKMAPFKSVRVGNRLFMQSDASVPANIMCRIQNR